MSEKNNKMDAKTLMMIATVLLSGGNLGVASSNKADSTQVELNKKQSEQNAQKIANLDNLPLKVEILKLEMKNNSQKLDDQGKKLDDQDKKLDEILKEMRKK